VRDGPANLLLGDEAAGVFVAELSVVFTSVTCATVEPIDERLRSTVEWVVFVPPPAPNVQLRISYSTIAFTGELIDIPVAVENVVSPAIVHVSNTPAKSATMTMFVVVLPKKTQFEHTMFSIRAAFEQLIPAEPWRHTVSPLIVWLNASEPNEIVPPPE
jgi:hypothetical protein